MWRQHKYTSSGSLLVDIPEQADQEAIKASILGKHSGKVSRVWYKYIAL